MPESDGGRGIVPWLCAAKLSISPSVVPEVTQSLEKMQANSVKGCKESPYKLAQHQREIERGSVDQESLQNILPALEVDPSHSASLIQVREAPLRQFAPQLL